MPNRVAMLAAFVALLPIAAASAQRPKLRECTGEFCDYCLVNLDANGDGVVDLADAGYFVSAVTLGKYDPRADLNCDGVLDAADLRAFAAEWPGKLVP